MKVYTLKREQFIEKPLEEVFHYFNQPENLEAITPRSLSFQILTPKPILMRQGTLIDYRIRILGIPQRWTSHISLYEPPYRFVDEQTRGPYQYWHHTHEFKIEGNGTLMTDIVRYAVPLGIMGRLTNFIFVKFQLNQIFDYRAKVIQDVFKPTRPN